MRRLLMVAAAIAVLVPAATASAQETAKVSVLHGIPGEAGFPVDVYVNADYTTPLLDDFTFSTLAGPLDLAAGSYSIEIYPGDADPAASDPALGPLEVTVEAGGNYTIAAHLTEGGEPTATVFANDITTLDAGQARVAVRHLAAAPPVDVLTADGSPVFEDLANPGEATAEVPAGTLTVRVVAAADNSVVALPDTPLALGDGTLTIVHAVGDLAAGSFTVVPQVIDGIGSAPSAVPTGDSGLAAEGSFPLALLAAMAGAALVLAGAGRAFARSRR